jgi:predicted amidophosphoribosyltransferase
MDTVYLLTPCVACGTMAGEGAAAAGSLCLRCDAGIAPVPQRRIGGADGILVGSAAHHEGSARRLVHRLKYQGLVAAADVLALRMVGAVPFQPTALVPVPRALARRVRYGVDPALVLAHRLSRHLDVPVVRALGASLWWRRHAGVSRSGRRSPGLRVVQRVDGSVLLVDDVVTTGATLLHAAGCLRYGCESGDVGRMAGVTATAAGTMSLYASEAKSGTT